MKTKTISASLFLVISFLLGTNPYTRARPQGTTPSPRSPTALTGEIKVAGAKTKPPGLLKGFKCDNLAVYAASREQNPKLPSSPMWMRRVRATGSWASGSCRYKMEVEANSFFHVQVQTLDTTFSSIPCKASFGTVVATTPKQATGLKVAANTTKTLNFTIDYIPCAVN